MKTITCVFVSILIPTLAAGQDVGTAEWLEKAAGFPFVIENFDDEYNEFVRGAQAKPPRGKAYAKYSHSLDADVVNAFDVFAGFESTNNPTAEQLREYLRSKRDAKTPVELVVFRPQQDRNKVKWVRKKLSVSPVTNRELLENDVEKKVDSINNQITWKHVSAPKIGETGFHVFFGRTETDKQPRALFEALHHDKEKYFGFEKLTIKCDSKVYEFERKIFQRKTEIGLQGISEWFTLELKGDQLNLIEDLATKSEIQIRWTGANFYQDGKFTSDDQDRFKTMSALLQCLRLGTLN